MKRSLRAGSLDLQYFLMYNQVDVFDYDKNDTRNIGYSKQKVIYEDQYDKERNRTHRRGDRAGGL